ncbi:MAG: NAD(P)/FAD-dependent oxidoreductase [Bacteroidales bacterium]|nr:NAD(P)/FAD-dependent oxidoreductase [Bacteroidales bacterium]MCM1414385.1 NAD(P)/FAD-dependent oxidoreductase [bacterium]MCM1422265.1 NAD(P)/FAD-dependent oxidoreductase [bacterium]
MKRVLIIGGGIAGLTAGIYCLQNGYEVTLCEKNTATGGECTGWDRQGYHIDNCIHWLTGTKPTDSLYPIWRNIGAINDDTILYHEPYFYALTRDGKTLHFWSNLEKARAEFLKAAPEDTSEINKLFDHIRLAESVRVPSEKSLADMNMIEYLQFGMTMADMGKVIKEYGNDTIADLAARFQNPLVREMLTQYLHPSYKAVTLLSSIGFYTGGSASIPMGGSVGMIRRITERFWALGGRLLTNMPAASITIEGRFARSVTFADGSNMPCDFVICATDPAVTFGSLLPAKYMDKKLRKMYETKDGYRVSSTFHISFGILGDAECGLPGGSNVYPCETYRVGKSAFDHIGIRLYDYDESLFPADKRVIQCNIPQENADYEYWKDLYADRSAYLAEKERIAETIGDRIRRLFPALENRLLVLDTYSPYTFTKWCGAYKGAYMSFFEQKGYKSLTAKNSLRGLSNVFLAGQWLSTNGGLPMAAASGRFAAAHILRADRK